MQQSCRKLPNYKNSVRHLLVLLPPTDEVVVSEADYRLAAIGIPGIKALLDHLEPGLGGHVRTPLQPYSKEALGSCALHALAVLIPANREDLE